MSEESKVKSSTIRTHLSTAELCRQRGWGPGTVLAGAALPKEAEQGGRLIQLTAIGVQTVLAIQLWPEEREEQAWSLKTREWKEVKSEKSKVKSDAPSASHQPPTASH